ncbi:MAG: hypothetical protein F6K37_22780 [Moorea sp. SIO4E2]|uniref:hypothetical protein n=1 Tax=Moorena sp. SIO4E2 TaxID=2607826 RepID=UPI0013B6CD4E|nr:hypothetical protein [Moorena sp. SIO4E2]NEQ08669.1 hypothetical protein [Moorena sp. SIO4E2]
MGDKSQEVRVTPEPVGEYNRTAIYIGPVTFVRERRLFTDDKNSLTHLEGIKNGSTN